MTVSRFRGSVTRSAARAFLPASRLVPSAARPRRVARNLVLAFLTLVVFLALAPWQQNLPGDGSVIAYAPDERPQALEATITGRIAQWHVVERQSVAEGELIGALQDADRRYDAVVFNGAGFTHTSVALRDSIAAMRVPVVEVHISNIHGREEFRERSLTAAKCVGVLTGLGLDGYRLAIDHLLRRPAPVDRP